ncbi:MAG: hypothetical protein LUH02_09605 [Erysipelotrichaceae bacterium]|nr:hypothetical protein [Erysipelotrichaceae bacterium]
MAKFIKKNLTCGACGHHIKIDVLASQHVSKVALDGNLNNATQYKTIQVCPVCGHVALNIEEPVKQVSLIQTKSDINYFLKGAETYVLNGNDVLASYMYRLASWKARGSHDDLWVEYKKKSIKYLEKYIDSLNAFNEGNIPYILILIDCFRMVGEFDKAKELCDDFLKILSQFKNKQLINYYTKAVHLELQYIENLDVSEHYNSEVH